MLGQNERIVFIALTMCPCAQAHVSAQARDVPCLESLEILEHPTALRAFAARIAAAGRVAGIRNIDILPGFEHETSRRINQHEHASRNRSRRLNTRNMEIGMETVECGHHEDIMTDYALRSRWSARSCVTTCNRVYDRNANGGC